MISAGGWLSSVRRIEGASFFFFFFVLYFFFNPVYSATNPNYTACAPQTCDGITVQYPFSLSSQSGSGCGYPGLSLVCLDNNHSLLLQTPSLNFTVTGIDYSARTIDVAIDPNYMVGTPNCRYPRKNIALQDITGATDPLPFVFTNGAPTQVTFFYNCTTPPSSGGPGGYVDGGGYDFTDKVVPSCSAAVWRSYAFFGSDSPGTVSMSCQSSVMFPVSASSTANNLASSLNDGFSMKWTLDAAVSNCRDCATSGGYCGSDSTTGSFVCFCQGHTHQATCNHSDSATGSFVCFCQDHTDQATCNHSGKAGRVKLIAGVAAAAAGSFLLATVAFFIWRCLGKKRTPSSKGFLTRSFSSSKTSSTIDMETRSFQQRCAGPVIIFTYKELEEATNNFSPSNELGDGRFGAVYLGKLHDGRKVAVKKLFESSYRRLEQFMNEIAILSGIHHPNLVCLYGCTSRHSRELLLVYEYVNNGTIWDHIHGMRSGGGHLTWKVRLNITVETAEALAHLHRLEPPIIHRDVKTNNILLDRDFHVKVADFGLSRLFPLDVTHVSTAPLGTPGYVDPDYHKCYQLTGKSDVYSFGVVLAELISSLPAVDIRRHRHEINLANMAVNKINNQELHEFVDSSLGFEADEWVNRTVRAVAELAFRCLVQEREIRPTMVEVAETLRQIQSGGELEKTALSPEKDTGALLKPTSRKSITDKCSSNYTTPNNSG